MNPFVETSFLVKLYVPEADSPHAVGIYAALLRPVTLCTLTDVEMASAILRKQIMDVKAVYADFRAHREAGMFHMVEVNEETFVLARRLEEQYARSLSLRSLDAIQLAAALQHGASEFVTMDKDLAEAAKAEGLAVLPVQP